MAKKLGKLTCNSYARHKHFKSGFMNFSFTTKDFLPQLVHLVRDEIVRNNKTLTNKNTMIRGT